MAQLWPRTERSNPLSASPLSPIYQPVPKAPPQTAQHMPRLTVEKGEMSRRGTERGNRRKWREWVTQQTVGGSQGEKKA